MKFPQIALIVVLSFAVAFVTGKYVVANHGIEGGTAKESVYQRVMRTGTVRCGYSSWNPLFFIDPTSGEKRGIFHDATEEIGNRLGLKIVWQEEIGWGTIVEALKTGRVDMACAGYWLNSGRIKNLSSSSAQLYSPLYVYVRQADTRSFNSMDDLNSDQLTSVSIDGSFENQVDAKRFPKAKPLTLPETNTNSDELETLTSGKADFLVLDSASADGYIANNPNKIRRLFPNQPAVVFPTVMLLPPEDAQFKEMIDDALRSIEYDGTLDTILKTYKMQNTFLRNARPGNLE